MSFIFEMIFDLFHYLTHRLLHTKYFYKLHKKHHKFQHPSIITTYYHSPLDLILTISMPTIIALVLFPLSYLHFKYILVYKSFTEISGHSGKRLFPTGSFPQFIWLPRFFNVDLYTEDHDLHHTLNNCNYSKKFLLWDRLFKTNKELIINDDNISDSCIFTRNASGILN
jgi:sterol desaturase/sphingolipid hydroxylase (fatty acid hydroxylase superfamily)